MKKRLSKLLIATILLVTLPLSAVYADGVPVSVSSGSATIGETVDITVSIDGVSEMGGGQVDVVYDPALLAPSASTSPYGVVKGEFIDSLGTFTVNLNEAEHKFVILWADFSLNTVTGSGNIFTVTLNAIAKGDATVSLENLNISNSAGSPIPSIAQNGTVTVTATPEYALGQVNDTTDAAGMQTALETYQAELGLTMTDYNALGSSYKTDVASELLSGKPYASVSALASAFDSAVAGQESAQELDDAIAEVNAAVNTEAMQTALTGNSAVLGIDLSGYNALSEAGKANVADTMGDQSPFASASAIADAFDAAVQTETDREELDAAVADADEAVSAAQALASGDLSTQALINAAQVQHDAAQDAIDAVFALDASYDTTTWDNTLSGVQSAIDDAQTRLNAVNAAIAAINAIPVESDPGHEDATIAARDAAEAALALGATTSDITNYDDLLAAEAVYYHGYLVGTFQKPNSAMTTTTVKVYLDGQMIGQKPVDFTGGNATFAYGEFQISEFNPGDANTVLTVTIPGYVYEADMGAQISIEDLSKGGGEGSDTLDLSLLTILPVAGDANNDGEIGLADLALMAQSFNTTLSSQDLTLDFNDDRTIDVKDLYLIGLNYGYGTTR